MSAMIGLGIAGGLIVIGSIAIVISGIKSLINGNQDIRKISSFLVPFAVFGIAYGMTGDITEAGVATMLFMMALMALMILFSGFRSTFNI
ncbi:MAG: hypothetical protein U5K31_03465 [Balneolaceae bacterium]|nr:hypothetical protein [Balneolaceae bacterium]